MVKLYKLYAPDRDEYHEKVSRAYSLLGIQHDDETPKMWCSRIRGPFRKMFEEYPDIFSKNECILMHAKLRSITIYDHSGIITKYINILRCSIHP
ncbi:uncharacterized protein OCT59_018938 [Rhizophagus irregularis]|uniref:uncharacterized protein n=1 Tax=Rhizophagus irregularis TaxID=588596 RepID=UPI00332D7336|nr:hypothetical protein OCT59_018938 [Rhizophagus irregularis]